MQLVNIHLRKEIPTNPSIISNGSDLKRYDSLLGDQIFFTTFHQSLDYEDFVEGLKPHVQTDADGNSIGVTYEPEDGIFKRACNAVQTDQSKDKIGRASCRERV